MKTILRCIRCDAVYPLDHGKKWGHSRASDGYGARLQCTNLVDAPHAPRAMDPATRQRTVIPQELCGGELSTESVADATPEIDIGEYGPGKVRGPLGVRKPGQG